jgi:hypothetical protein
LVDVYPLAALGVAVLYGWLVRNRWYFLSAAAVFACWAGTFGWQAYHGLRRAMAGLDYLLAGLALFAVAMLISLAKAGLLPRWFASRGAGDAHAADEPGSDANAE